MSGSSILLYIVVSLY